MQVQIHVRKNEKVRAQAVTNEDTQWVWLWFKPEIKDWNEPEIVIFCHTAAYANALATAINGAS